MNERALHAMRAAPRAALLLCAATLAACQTQPLRPTPQQELAWESRQAQLALLDGWTLQGRFSSGLGAKGNLNLRQDGDRFALRLWGPFGAGVVSIAGDPQQVEVRTPEQSFVTAEPETALEQELGWTMPIARLRWWALGLPAPDSHARIERLDAAGRLARMQQDGWTLAVDEYQDAQGQSLPRRLSLAGPDVSLKLVVDGWQLPEALVPPCAGPPDPVESRVPDPAESPVGTPPPAP